MNTSENRKKASQSEAVVCSNTGMTEEMQKEAISIAKQAFQKYDKQYDMAVYIYQDFIKKYGGKWSCIIGINYGSHVCRKDYFFSFFLGVYGITLFDFPN
jgi:dynein light chain LC8-type